MRLIVTNLNKKNFFDVKKEILNIKHLSVELMNTKTYLVFSSRKSNIHFLLDNHFFLWFFLQEKDKRGEMLVFIQINKILLERGGYIRFISEKPLFSYTPIEKEKMKIGFSVSIPFEDMRKTSSSPLLIFRDKKTLFFLILGLNRLEEKKLLHLGLKLFEKRYDAYLFVLEDTFFNKILFWNCIKRRGWYSCLVQSLKKRII